MNEATEPKESVIRVTRIDTGGDPNVKVKLEFSLAPDDAPAWEAIGLLLRNVLTAEECAELLRQFEEARRA